MKDNQTFVVIGAGQMGAGIAQVAAACGFKTLMYDLHVNAAEKSLVDIERRLNRAIEREKITEDDKTRTLSNLVVIDSMSQMGEAGFVVEAIIENLEIKSKLFKELDAYVSEKTILASNTSSISITKLASCVSKPERFIGMHFMNPVPVMKLVEIICGLQTSAETCEKTRAIAERMGKETVLAKHDYPGFLVNRILVPWINEAVFVLQEGIAEPKDIDTAMKLGTNVPMGPLELADFIGLDTCLYITQIFHQEFGDSKYRPCPLLVKYVEAGWLGKKTGKGFYEHNQ